ncbi:MAG: PAS domain S-box protein [Planctomycetes bacterium]|nr:PAS domain S-box protein [Planctomycetota bacterium]
MSDSSFQDDLEALRTQLTALERLASEQPGAMPLSCAPILADVRMCCERMQSRDVAQRASAEALRQSETRKAAILDASLDAVITVDERGCVVEFNTAAESMFGYKREYAIGQVLSDLVAPSRLKHKALEVLSRLRAGAAGQGETQRFQAIAITSDGAELAIEVAIAPLGLGAPKLLTLYIHDATSRKRAEDDLRRNQRRLQALTAELLLTEERERRRLAIDLHDGLSQTIALARIKLASLRPALTDERAMLLDEIGGLIEEADRAARSVSFELSPPMLHDMGLEAALQWLVEHLGARYGIQIVLEDDGLSKSTDERTRVILFRSIRELLINAAKHAGARAVRLRVFREGTRLGVAVEDDGVGMQLGAGDSGGFGLFSIRERMGHVGGSMRIDSAAGRGTRIELRAPLLSGQLSKVGDTT